MKNDMKAAVSPMEMDERLFCRAGCTDHGREKWAFRFHAQQEGKG